MRSLCLRRVANVRKHARYSRNVRSFRLLLSRGGTYGSRARPRVDRIRRVVRVDILEGEVVKRQRAVVRYAPREDLHWPVWIVTKDDGCVYYPCTTWPTRKQAIEAAERILDCTWKELLSRGHKCERAIVFRRKPTASPPARDTPCTALESPSDPPPAGPSHPLPETTRP